MFWVDRGRLTVSTSEVEEFEESELVSKGREIGIAFGVVSSGGVADPVEGSGVLICGRVPSGGVLGCRRARMHRYLYSLSTWTSTPMLSRASLTCFIASGGCCVVVVV